MQRELHIRSIVKTVSWRFIATMTTFSLVWIFTGKLNTAVFVGGIEAVAKMIFYFLHERGWNRVKWGKHEIQPFVVWITGLSASGKTTIAKKVAEALTKKDLKIDHLDGETIRNLFPQTGFSRDEVNEHVERVGYLASKLEEKGVCVVASFISPYREGRHFIRAITTNFIEVYICTPADVCELRDDKQLYERAKKGEIKHLPGVDLEYETTENPELTIDTSDGDYDRAANLIMKYLKMYL